RNIHGRKLKEINKMADHWETAPRHMMRLDIRSLLQDAAIEEVEMEDFDANIEEQKEEKKDAEEEESELEGSESLPAETALKNSCNVKLAISKKQSGTCISKETHKKEKT
ncbi:YLPM1 isoform 6, partial [Pan troglodytes]